MSTHRSVGRGHVTFVDGPVEVEDPLLDMAMDSLRPEDNSSKSSLESMDIHKPFDKKARDKSRIHKQRGGQRLMKGRASRWVADLLTGIIIAVFAELVHYGYDELSKVRLNAVERALGDYEDWHAAPAWPWLRALLTEIGISLAFVFVAAACCTWQPTATSSGIPGVIAFLNGVDLTQRLFTFKVLLAKVVGVIFCCASSLAVGPEGPMVHIGACVGVLTYLSLQKIPHLHNTLRSSYGGRKLEVHCAAVGGGCGISAAFRAPLAGTLFVVEEASTYFSPRFFLHVFCAGAIAVLLLQLFGTVVTGGSYFSLFQVWTGPDCDLFGGLFFFSCMVIGLICGFLGCLFNAIVNRLSVWRQVRKTPNPNRPHRFAASTIFMLEVLCYSVLSSCVAVGLPFSTAMSGCRPSTVRNIFSNSNMCIERDWQSQVFTSQENVLRSDEGYDSYQYNPNGALFGIQYDPVVCPQVQDAENCGVDTFKEQGLTFPAHWTRSMEEMICCAFTNKTGTLVPLSYQNPRSPLRMDEEQFPNLGCPEVLEDNEDINYYNPMAAMAFVPGRVAINSLFTRGSPTLIPWTYIMAFLPCYFILAAITAGTAIPSGLVVPMMLIGGSVGRLVGIGFSHLSSTPLDVEDAVRLYSTHFQPIIRWLYEENSGQMIFAIKGRLDPGICAVVGAAAFMSASGGIVLFVLSMLVEITGDIKLVVPIAIGSIIGRAIVHVLRKSGLYHDLIHIAHLPFLEHRRKKDEMDPKHTITRLPKSAPREGEQPTSAELARRKLRCFPEAESLVRVRRVLEACGHNGFPVVDSHGLLRGLVLRSAAERLLAEAEQLRAPLLSKDDVLRPGGGSHTGIEIQPCAVGSRVWSDCDHAIAALHPRLDGGTLLATEAARCDEAGEVYFEFAPCKSVQVWVLYDEAYEGALPPWLSKVRIPKAARVRAPSGETHTFSAFLLRSLWVLGEDQPVGLPHNRFFSGSPQEAQKALTGMTYWVVMQEVISFKDEMDFSPYCVRADLPVFRAHMLFQRLGLRHLVVVDNRHKPMGVLTRASFIDDHEVEESPDVSEEGNLDQSYASFAREMLRSHKSSVNRPEPRMV